MKGWQKIFNTEHIYRAEIVKDVLEDRGITPVIISKKDSSYTMIGHHELHVRNDEVIEALKIIENDINFR